MPATLTNYLGTGSNPRLRLTLADNQPPKWDAFTIDYSNAGNTPTGWSVWNVTDENGNYYGTITLTSNGTNLAFVNYVAGSDGFYLEDIKLNNGQLSVDKIHRPNNSAGPFPNTPRAQPAVFAGTNTPIKLSVNGADVVDNFGRKIKLKGVARPSLEWNPEGQFLSPDDIKKMASWGSNVIRLDLNQDFWFKSQGADVKGSYKQIIDAIIAEATKNGMAVILDLHWPDATVKQAPMANRDSLKFWQEVATRYKDFGTVIFELYNEPRDIDQKTWLNGNVNYAGYQEMLDVVRATGANNPVIVNGLDWGYDLNFVGPDFRVKGENIIYGSHPYCEKIPQNLPYLLANFPLIFTEFGDNDPRDYPFNYPEVYQRVLKYVAQNNVHYTGFAWWVEPNNPAFPALISDWNGTPVNGGVLVRDDMKKNPPTNFFQPPAHVLSARSQLVAQPIHPLASYLAAELTKFQDRCSHDSVVFGILRQCMTAVLNPKNDPKFLLGFIESKRDEIKDLEKAKHSCWPFGFFCATPITDQLSNLLDDAKAQMVQSPRHRI